MLNQSLHEFVIEYTARAALSASGYSKQIRDLTQFEEGESGGSTDPQAAQMDAGMNGKDDVRCREENRGADLLLESLDAMIDGWLALG